MLADRGSCFCCRVDLQLQELDMGTSSSLSGKATKRRALQRMFIPEVINSVKVIDARLYTSLQNIEEGCGVGVFVVRMLWNCLCSSLGF